jgi:hypothetical protein
MPFEFKKLLNHGVSNPIVARLSLQILEILRQTKAAKDVQDAVGGLYLNSLQKKLIRCYEINERFKKEFASEAAKYKPPAQPNAPVEVPQIPNLEEECHNFLYEAKNYIRDLLQVVNQLYSTSYDEASEFSRAKKGRQSLIEFAETTFGANDPKTLMLKEAAPFVEEIIAKRNAVEHPDGYSGKLAISNFMRGADNKLDEPGWHRVKDEKPVNYSSSVRMDLEASIHNLLSLGEDVFVSWAADHLMAPEAMRIGHIPEAQRDPKCAIKYKVTLSKQLADKLAEAQAKATSKNG